MAAISRGDGLWAAVAAPAAAAAAAAAVALRKALPLYPGGQWRNSLIFPITRRRRRKQRRKKTRPPRWQAATALAGGVHSSGSEMRALAARAHAPVFSRRSSMQNAVAN